MVSLLNRFDNNMLEAVDAKSTYKELRKHSQSAKYYVTLAIKEYQIDGKYGKMFNTLNKNEDRKAILESLLMVQSELNNVNV